MDVLVLSGGGQGAARRADVRGGHDHGAAVGRRGVRAADRASRRRPRGRRRGRVRFDVGAGHRPRLPRGRRRPRSCHAHRAGRGGARGQERRQAPADGRRARHAAGAGRHPRRTRAGATASGSTCRSASSARASSIQAKTFDANGTAGAGLTSATFVDDVQFREDAPKGDAAHRAVADAGRVDGAGRSERGDVQGSGGVRGSRAGGVRGAGALQPEGRHDSSVRRRCRRRAAGVGRAGGDCGRDDRRHAAEAPRSTRAAA